MIAVIQTDASFAVFFSLEVASTDASESLAKLTEVSTRKVDRCELAATKTRGSLANFVPFEDPRTAVGLSTSSSCGNVRLTLRIADARAVSRQDRNRLRVLGAMFDHFGRCNRL